MEDKEKEIKELRELSQILGHGIIASEVSKEPTCKLEGEKIYKNLDTKKTYIKTIPKVQHRYQEGVCIWCGRKYSP